VSRTWQYGLNYYAGHEIPECAGVDAADAARRPRITTRDRQLAMEDASVHKVVQ